MMVDFQQNNTALNKTHELLKLGSYSMQDYVAVTQLANKPSTMCVPVHCINQAISVHHAVS